MKEKIKEGGDRKKLRSLIDEKLNVMNDFKGNSKDDLSNIVKLTNDLLDNLRFADGRTTLKDCLAEMRLKKLGEKYDRKENEDKDSGSLTSPS